MRGVAADHQNFPKSARLLKSADFGDILRTRDERSFRVRSAYLTVYGRYTDVPGSIRLGITVGKKNAQRSVDRALVKRVLRESFRLHRSALYLSLTRVSQGVDLSFRLSAPFSVAMEEADNSLTSVKKLFRRNADDLLQKISVRALRLSKNSGR